MKIVVEKDITKELSEVILDKWVKINNFDLFQTSIPCTPLKLDLNLFYGDFKEFKKFIQTSFDDVKIDHKAAVGFYLSIEKDGTTWHNLLITENNWLPEHYGTIAHEIHHFVHYGLEEKGVNYGSGGEEVYAYLSGYYMQMIVQAFVEFKKQIKKK